MATRPADCRYTKTHEWVRLEGTTAVVGITDFAVEHLGELVFVDLPAKGKKLGKGETLAEVESVKAVGEVYAPVAGEVAESERRARERPDAAREGPVQDRAGSRS